MINNDRSRTRLKWAVGVAALAPAVSALQAIAQGAHGLPGTQPPVSATIDGELRYAKVFQAAVAPILWSRLDRVEDSSAVTASLTTMFAGGLARLLAWKHSGRPHPVSLVAIALEVGAVPALLVWRHRVSSRRD